MNYNFENENETVQIIQINSVAFYTLAKQIFEKLLAERKEKKTWLTSIETMSILNIKKTTLGKLRMSGSLSYSKFGRKILYSSESVEQYLRENTLEKF